MKYEVILFDADDTLFDFKKSEREAFKNTMVEFNIQYNENHHLSIYQAINTSLWKEFEKGLITQEKLKVERFKRLSDSLNAGFDENEFAKAYIGHLANCSFLLEESIELVMSLYQDYRLTIVTNGLKDVQNKRIGKSVISRYFEDIVVSEAVQVSKPDPRIFEYALNNIKYSNKSKVLIVGDSLTSDIQGGINSSIDTCWYNPSRMVNQTGIIPVYEISNLMELRNILKNP